ncbi:hypothetical protein WJX79_004321 [Trebouxia sp. C0005]
MEIVCTWKAPSLANRLGKASAGFWVKAEVRSTAANVACDGVADTVFPGGKTMEALRMRLAEEDEDCDEKERLNATVACRSVVALAANRPWLPLRINARKLNKPEAPTVQEQRLLHTRDLSHQAS